VRWSPMATLFRWLIRLFLAAIVLAGLALVIAVWFATRSLPDYNANYQLAGVSAPVTIVRNNADIPHIFGANDPDVYFALGFAHAQDRLWQMTLMRRTAQGKLSELFGERTLKVDTILRRFDLYGLADQSVAAQDDYTKAALNAYSAGVNAWISEVNKGALGRGAPEFFLFSSDIAPWQPTDSIALVKLMALNLSAHLDAEVFRARASLVLPGDRLLDLLPDDPGQGVAALPPYAALFDDAAFPTRFADAVTPLNDPLSPFRPAAFSGASNAWAAAPIRSTSGSTLLANDPHLGFSAPSIWYLARLELQSGGVIGGTIPGIPLILVGRSEDLGWGLTTAYVDDQDVMIEKLNPDRPNEVLGTDGTYVPMREKVSVIKVKDQPDVSLRLQWTENGPVLPAGHYNLGLVTPEGHVATVSWTALSATDTSMTAAMRLMRAKSVADGIRAGELYVAPAQTLTLADKTGIAMKVIGSVPRRDPSHQTQGRLPAPGWVAANRWLGTMPYASNPEFVDPVGGIVANTNNKVIDRPFPDHLSFFWLDTQRILRLTNLLQGREVHTRDSFIEAQLDTVSNAARTQLALVGAELWFSGEPAAAGTIERQRQDALKLLADWNGEMNEHQPEPLVYSVWMRTLQRRLIEDDIGPLANAFGHVDPVFIERVYRNVDGAARWCDIIQSAAVETCADTARIALDEALVWISENVPGKIESLRWGDMHQATHDHSVLGDIPVLSYIVNIRQSTSGDGETINMGQTSGGGANPFLNVLGPAYRGVYDFADPDSSVFIMSTGQSGHFLSRHYDDLGELWRRGEYVPMSLDPDLARAASVGVTEITPPGG
jgi:penicillin G amidase